MYVLMVVPSNFPNGDAGAVRDMAFAKVYQELGYNVVLIGVGQNKKEGEYFGVEYYSVYKEIRGGVGHLERFMYEKSNYLKLIEKVISDRGFPKLFHINDISHAVIQSLIKLSNNFLLHIK